MAVLEPVQLALPLAKVRLRRSLALVPGNHVNFHLSAMCALQLLLLLRRANVAVTLKTPYTFVQPTSCVATRLRLLALPQAEVRL